jgi:hypothetical protein
MFLPSPTTGFTGGLPHARLGPPAAVHAGARGLARVTTPFPAQFPAARLVLTTGGWATRAARKPLSAATANGREGLLAAGPRRQPPVNRPGLPSHVFERPWPPHRCLDPGRPRARKRRLQLRRAENPASWRFLRRGSPRLEQLRRPVKTAGAAPGSRTVEVLGLTAMDELDLGIEHVVKYPILSSYLILSYMHRLVQNECNAVAHVHAIQPHDPLIMIHFMYFNFLANWSFNNRSRRV